MILCVVLPEQVLPSLFRLYPVLQLHRKDPTVLVQTWLQPPLLTAHSLISTDERLQSHIFLCIMLWTYQSKFFHCLKDYSHFCSHSGMIPLCWCKLDHSHQCWQHTHWYLQMNDYSHTYFCASCFEPTRASSSIAWKTIATSAATTEWSHCVDANLITATIVERTLRDVYRWTITVTHITANHALILYTRACSSIAWKSITTSAATSKRSRSVGTNLTTTISVERTLVDIYTVKHNY